MPAGHPLSLDLSDQVAALSAGELSSVELVEACQARIARHDATFRAFIAQACESAVIEARALDRARARDDALGPLHGVAIAVKDNVDVRGLATTAGSRLREDTPAAADAPAVAGLRAAGAVIIGKTNLDEFAYGSTTQNAARRAPVRGGPPVAARVRGRGGAGAERPFPRAGLIAEH